MYYTCNACIRFINTEQKPDSDSEVESKSDAELIVKLKSDSDSE